jgi:hypothetical protein
MLGIREPSITEGEGRSQTFPVIDRDVDRSPCCQLGSLCLSGHAVYVS